MFHPILFSYIKTILMTHVPLGLSNALVLPASSGVDTLSCMLERGGRLPCSRQRIGEDVLREWPLNVKRMVDEVRRQEFIVGLKRVKVDMQDVTDE